MQHLATMLNGCPHAGDGRNNIASGWAPRKRDVYEEKWAVKTENKYNDKDPMSWYVGVTNYLIGRNPEVEKWLEWVENKGDIEIDLEMVIKAQGNTEDGGLMMDMIPTAVSQDIWAFLNLNLTGEPVHVLGMSLVLMAQKHGAG